MTYNDWFAIMTGGSLALLGACWEHFHACQGFLIRWAGALVMLGGLAWVLVEVL